MTVDDLCFNISLQDPPFRPVDHEPEQMQLTMQAVFWDPAIMQTSSHALSCAGISRIGHCSFQVKVRIGKLLSLFSCLLFSVHDLLLHRRSSEHDKHKAQYLQTSCCCHLRCSPADLGVHRQVTGDDASYTGEPDHCFHVLIIAGV